MAIGQYCYQIAWSSGLRAKNLAVCHLLILWSVLSAVLGGGLIRGERNGRKPEGLTSAAIGQVEAYIPISSPHCGLNRIHPCLASLHPRLSAVGFFFSARPRDLAIEVSGTL